MPPPDLDIGALLIQLKAASEQATRGIRQTQKLITDLGNTTTKTAVQMQKANQATARSLEEQAAAQAKQSARVQAVTSRILAFQTVVTTLGNQAGDSMGKVRKATDSAIVGLTTFIGVTAIVPGRLGIIAGATAGLSLAVAGFVAQTSREAVAALDNATKASIAADRQIAALRVTLQDAGQVAFLLGDGSQIAATNLSILRQAAANSVKEIRSVQEQISDLRRAMQGAAEEQIPGMRAQLGSLERLLAALQQRQKDFTDVTKAASIAMAEYRVAVQETANQLAELNKQTRLSKGEIEAGISTPMQAAEAEIQAVEAALRSTLERIDELKAKGVDTTELQTSVGALTGQLENARNRRAQLQAPQKFADSFAMPFARAIGNGLQQAILEGQDAMETLANVGEGFFREFLGNSVEFFQKKMIEGLTAVAGAGGEILGQALSAAVGIAGFFLSGRGRGGAQQSFAGGPGGVTSTQAVRGIVAGPTSVSIASVGDNLRNAMAGVEQRLEALIRISDQIRINTGGRGAGGGAGFPFAGSVAT